MNLCAFCKKEIPYKSRKSHECNEYLTHLDNENARKYHEEQDKVANRIAILIDDFTASQASAIIELIEYMRREA
jgi:hypothetical protein